MTAPFIVFEEKLDRWDSVIRAFPRETSLIIRKATFDAYARSQLTVPVRRPDVVARTGVTGGFLKQSGQPDYNDRDQAGEIRYTAYYAGYVHEGTFRMEPRPFLRDAVEDVVPSMIRAFTGLEGRLL